jgi:hypothetical protein
MEIVSAIEGRGTGLWKSSRAKATRPRARGAAIFFKATEATPRK